jgi:hypothetical protein
MGRILKLLNAGSSRKSNIDSSAHLSSRLGQTGSVILSSQHAESQRAVADQYKIQILAQ